MKVKVTPDVLNVFMRMTAYGLRQKSEDIIFNQYYQDALQSLIIKQARAKKRIRKALTLELHPGEAFAFQVVTEYWKQDGGSEYEYSVSEEKILSGLKQSALPPHNKQL